VHNQGACHSVSQAKQVNKPAQVCVVRLMVLETSPLKSIRANNSKRQLPPSPPCSLLLRVCPTFLVSRQTSLCTASKSRSSPSTTRRARLHVITHTPFSLAHYLISVQTFLFGCSFEPWVLRLPAAVGRAVGRRHHRPIRHRGTERRGTGGGTGTLHHLPKAADPLEVGLSAPEAVEGRCGEGAGWG
jgi:hypothetical protein